MEKTEIKERPIIMGAESVLAILEGRKTQTRRVVKPSIKGCTVGVYTAGNTPIVTDVVNIDEDGDPYEDILCPYGKVGDRLWVRESYCGCWGGLGHSLKCNQVTDAKVKQENGNFCEASPSEPVTVFYRANGDEEKLKHLEWKSSMFMPRWASRITLEITDIRVESVQDITEDDAIAEGCSGRGGIFLRTEAYPPVNESIPIQEYRTLWDSLNAKRGYPWEKNPWVWVIEFKVVGEQ